MPWFSKKTEALPEGWNNFTSVEEWDEIVRRSAEKPQLVFKHSTRCSISAAAKYRLLRTAQDLFSKMDTWYLDLLKHRDASNAVAEKTGIMHESPQVILLVNGKPVYSATHNYIFPEELLSAAGSGA